MDTPSVRKNAMELAHKLMFDGFIKVEDPDKYASTYAKLVDDIYMYMDYNEYIDLSSMSSFKEKLVKVNIVNPIIKG